MINHFKIARNKFDKQKEPKYKKGNIVITTDPKVPIIKIESEGIRYETGMTYSYSIKDLKTEKWYSNIPECDFKRIATKEEIMAILI